MNLSRALAASLFVLPLSCASWGDQVFFQKLLPDGTQIRATARVEVNPPLPDISDALKRVPPGVQAQAIHVNRASHYIIEMSLPKGEFRRVVSITEYWSTLRPPKPWAQPFGIHDVAVDGERMLVLYHQDDITRADVFSMAPGAVNLSLLASPPLLLRNIEGSGQRVFRGRIEGSIDDGTLLVSLERGANGRMETLHEFTLKPENGRFVWTPDFNAAERLPPTTRPASRPATRPTRPLS